MDNKEPEKKAPVELEDDILDNVSAGTGVADASDVLTSSLGILPGFGETSRNKSSAQ